MKYLVLLAFMPLLLASCAVLKPSATKSVDIQLIRNATLKINYNGKTFLVDPSLSAKKSFMSFVVPDQNLNPTVELPLPIDEITKDVDAILVTHTHVDHFDQAAMDALDPSLPLFAQPFDRAKLEESPFKQLNYVEDQLSFAQTNIIRTNGKHGPDELLEGLGQVSGFILQAEKHPTIYIVGDCLWDDEIKEHIKQYQPDIIVVNSGGAQWGGAKILMDEQSVVDLAKYAGDAKIVAVHMEALDHCLTSRKSLKEKCNAENITVMIPEDGEVLNL